MQTYVIAQRITSGREWARLHDIEPFARTTNVIVNPVQLQGVALRPDDRVYWVPGVEWRAAAEDMELALIICGAELTDDELERVLHSEP